MRGGSKNSALFFSISRRKFHSFCLSLEVFSWNFGVLKRGDPRLPTRLRGRRGFTRQPQELQTFTFDSPGASNTTKIPQEDTQRKTKRAEMEAERGEKNAKFGALHPSGPTSFRAPLLFAHTQQKKDWQNTMAQIGLAKVGFNQQVQRPIPRWCWSSQPDSR